MENADILNIIDYIEEILDTLDFYAGEQPNPEVETALAKYAAQSRSIREVLQNNLNQGD